MKGELTFGNLLRVDGSFEGKLLSKVTTKNPSLYPQYVMGTFW